MHVRLELEFGSDGQLGRVKNQLKSLNKNSYMDKPLVNSMDM